MQTITEENITNAVLASMRPTSARTHLLLAGLVKHLHAFVREVEPTEAEWLAAVQFLTRTGQMCSDKRQEFILLSDVLGVSMLVDAINHRTTDGTTETTVTGPFYVPPRDLPLGSLIATGPEAERGEPTVVRGTVTNPAGQPVPGATIAVWQSDDLGYYDTQDPGQPDENLRALLRPDAAGYFWFRTIKPAPYPIPDDGPVGHLLRTAGRHPMRPAHIHFMLTAPGYEPVVTHLFVAGDEFLESDAVFGVKESLVLPFVLNHSLADAQRYGTSAPFYDVSYDFKLRPVPA
ncbi:dioxygenase [uncultured Hymenobacter sp.]|uniref:dioxygenase family protein n=1 Tax=uncultured Hymenobacter sp. TaxID=170016 RepID=UPI0035CBB508